MGREKIPNAVFQRMAQYFMAVLSAEESSGLITSARLGRMTGVDAARVRNDLHYFGGFGSPGRGYDRQQLLSRMLGLLGLDREQSILLLGSDPVVYLMMRRALGETSPISLLTEAELCPGLPS